MLLFRFSVNNLSDSSIEILAEELCKHKVVEVLGWVYMTRSQRSICTPLLLFREIYWHIHKSSRLLFWLKIYIKYAILKFPAGQKKCINLKSYNCSIVLFHCLAWSFSFSLLQCLSFFNIWELNEDLLLQLSFVLKHLTEDGIHEPCSKFRNHSWGFTMII